MSGVEFIQKARLTQSPPPHPVGLGVEGGLTQTMLTLENALSAPGGEGLGADPGEPARLVASVDGLGQALAIGKLK